MDKLTKLKIKNRMKNKRREEGFSYIETMVALVIVTIGILAVISALTWNFLYMQEAEKRTRAKQMSNSTIESIFAVRDLNSSSTASALGIGSWDLIQNKTVNNSGIFVTGWYPVRVGPGADGIYGTADDSCNTGSSCSNNAELTGYSRKIDITDIVENNVVKKRMLVITIQYYVGQASRQEVISTIIANLPFGSS